LVSPSPVLEALPIADDDDEVVLIVGTAALFCLFMNKYVVSLMMITVILI
jgi:hypothetical protein